jgi:hypothetical protein
MKGRHNSPLSASAKMQPSSIKKTEASEAEEVEVEAATKKAEVAAKVLASLAKAAIRIPPIMKMATLSRSQLIPTNFTLRSRQEVSAMNSAEEAEAASNSVIRVEATNREAVEVATRGEVVPISSVAEEEEKDLTLEQNARQIGKRLSRSTRRT